MRIQPFIPACSGCCRETRLKTNPDNSVDVVTVPVYDILPEPDNFKLDKCLKAGINLEEINSKLFSPTSFDGGNLFATEENYEQNPKNEGVDENV